VASDPIDQVGIYIHIPFCVAKCYYCAFNSYAGLEHLHLDYIEALQREIARCARDKGSFRASSVYLGGGTPSLLSIDSLSAILGACLGSFAAMEGTEISVEANPGTVSASYLWDLRAQGVNRLSLGAQSFDDSILRLLGRIHTSADVKQSYESARDAGFQNVNLDLIYGIPTQTLEAWQEDLAEAMQLEPEHLSLYCLSVEEGTPLAKSISRGELPSPDPDLAAAMYASAQESLAEADYAHYEISNWAVAGRECQHNITYWRNQPYLGFGAGAHSFDGQARYYNVASPEEYVQRVLGGQEAMAGRDEIDHALEMSDTMIMGLRMCQGVSFSDFEDRFGSSPIKVYGYQIRELIGLGLLDANASGVRLTERGRLLGNEVFERFLPPATD
jgi:oxygen-independent coproporphyrinogen-3 oxidase